MVKTLASDHDSSWLQDYSNDFKRRFINLLGYQFSAFKPATALQVLSVGKKTKDGKLTKSELDMHMIPYDLKRIRAYSKSLVDYHLIMDLVPRLARLFFTNKLDIKLSVAQQAILLGIGLQSKSVEDISKEIDLPTSQTLGLFNRVLKQVNTFLHTLESQDVEMKLTSSLKDKHAADKVQMEAIDQTLDDELKNAADEVLESQQKNVNSLMLEDLKQYEIGGTPEAWNKALSSGKKMNIVSIASDNNKKRSTTSDDAKPKKKKKKMKK